MFFAGLKEFVGQCFCVTLRGSCANNNTVGDVGQVRDIQIGNGLGLIVIQYVDNEVMQWCLIGQW